MKSDSLILAIDIGSSSLRTALFTTDAHRLIATTAQRHYTLLRGAEGAAELVADDLYKALLQCMSETLEAKRQDPNLQRLPIAAAGVSCFWHSLLGVDDKGAPRTPVYTWADSRCSPDAAKLREEFSEEEIHRRTGCMLRTPYWPAKLRWLARTEPEQFSRARRWISPAEWLQEAFCGDVSCAYGMATGTGLLNPGNLDWDSELLQSCGISRERLNPLGDEPARLTSRMANRFPELGDTLWFPAIGDGAAGNLGSGATRGGFAAINLGTSGALRVVKEGRETKSPFGLFSYRVDARRFLVGGAINNAGNLYQWCLDTLKLKNDTAEIEECLIRYAKPEHGLVVAPFWSGERSPGWRENVRGAVSGITQRTTPLDLLQAITESAYYSLAGIADALLKAKKNQTTVIVSGGAARSPATLQRLANILDIPIHPNDEPEASLRGAAIFAIEKQGGAVMPFERRKPVQPQPEISSLYSQERQKHDDFVKRHFGAGAMES